MNKFKKISKVIGLIIFALLFYFAGYLVGHKNLVFEQNYKPKIINQELVKPRQIDFGIFWDAWNKVMEKYAGEPDAQNMVYGAISGMIQSLGDPYSAFMEPNASKSFLEDLSGEIQGIGAEISLQDKKLIIVSPLSDSPAQKAGLKPNDQILKINDESTEGLSLEQAIGQIRGKAGTKVSLTILRSDWTQPRVFEIIRQKIKINSVEWEIKENNIAYIKVIQFGEDTTKLIKKAATEIDKQNPRAIILDLRHNPGGYLDAAIDVASIFMEKNSVVVKEKFKDGRVEEEKTTQEPILAKYKLVVLIDGGSASGSEIIAGALQDYKRAKLIGEKTFGKGSVQNLEGLQGGASLRLTVAQWLTPQNRVINSIGIEPDIKVELSEEDLAADRDPQLEKAMKEVLK